jgi:hypothetical protein
MWRSCPQLWDDVCTDIVHASPLEIFVDRQANGTNGPTPLLSSNRKQLDSLPPISSHHLTAAAAPKLTDDVHDRGVLLPRGRVAKYPTEDLILRLR